MLKRHIQKIDNIQNLQYLIFCSFPKMSKIETLNKGYFTTMSEFKMIKQIGVGSFGKVNLAMFIPTKKKYAIKIIGNYEQLSQLDLTDNFNNVEIKLIERQIKSHMNLDHPHIIKLWDTFQQKCKIYMIMEYAVNSSLFRYHTNLLSKGVFPPTQQIHKFFSQVLSALKYMHNNDLMHRDLKPQNILLDDDLNIKVCDFGWVTNQITTHRNTFCGTYEYMAPEMVLEKSYDYKIDIWAIGVLLYELLHGRAPFPGQNLQEVRNRINQGSYQISNTVSITLKNLIADILQFLPQKRLTLQQIQKHPWMISQQSLYNISDQLVPKLKNCRSSDIFMQKVQSSIERDKKKPLNSILKNTQSIDRTKPTKKFSPTFSTLLTQSKDTMKLTTQQKRIKKKCKTQGQQQIASYEQYLCAKNMVGKKNTEYNSVACEQDTQRVKKNNFICINKDVRQLKINKSAKQVKQVKQMKQNDYKKVHVPTNIKQSRGKLKKGNKQHDKNNSCDIDGCDKIKTIQDKLTLLSTKFFHDRHKNTQNAQH